MQRKIRVRRGMRTDPFTKHPDDMLLPNEPRRMPRRQPDRLGDGAVEADRPTGEGLLLDERLWPAVQAVLPVRSHPPRSLLFGLLQPGLTEQGRRHRVYRRRESSPWRFGELGQPSDRIGDGVESDLG